MTIFDFQLRYNVHGDISVSTACQGRQAEHDRLAREMAEFEARGGKVECVAKGVSGIQDGVYGALAKHLNKRQQNARKKLYDDSPETDEQE